MRAAAEAERFEEAARVRDQLRAVERSLERQRVVQDGLGRAGRLRRAPRRAAPRHRGARGSPAAGSPTPGPSLSRSRSFPPRSCSSSFLGLYYDGGAATPRELLLPLPLRRMQALRGVAGGEGRASRPACWSRSAARSCGWWRWPAPTPSRPPRRSCRAATTSRTRWRAWSASSALSRPPRVIECYDISNFQGTEVGRLGGVLRRRPARQGALPALPHPAGRGPGRLRHALRGPDAPAAQGQGGMATCPICW